MIPPVDTDVQDGGPGRARSARSGPRLVESPPKGQGQADSYDDTEAVRKLVERCIEDAAGNSARLERDLQDIGNQRFYRGGARNHWIWRSPSNPNQWSERPFTGPDGIPAWVPRCSTNLFANKIDGVVSILVQSDPAKSVRPATDDDSDIASANVGDRVLPVLEEEIGARSIKRQLSQLIALQNAAAVVYYYDNDPKHGTADLPIFLCADCAAMPTEENGGGYSESWQVDEAEGACPHCGGENVEPFVNPETGLVDGLTYATGKVCAEVVNSLGFSVPSNATTLDATKLAWVLLHPAEAVEDVCAKWPDHAEHIRNVGSKGRKGGATQASSYAEELRTMSSPSSANGASVGSGSKNGPVIVYRLQHEPITTPECKFPDGLYAVMVGDKVLESGPLPVTDGRTKKRRKSILIRTYREMPGQPFGKPVADDLFPLQHQYNQLETLAYMSAMHHAAPTVFLPTSVTLEDDLTGQPGATVRYRSMDGQKPSLEQGTGVHATVYELLDRTEQKMDVLSGLNGVLQGARPEGGKATAFEVQALQERGMAAFRTPLECLVDFEREQALLLFDIARDSIWVPRFQKVMGEEGAWEIEQFLGADLSGHMDVVIDPMSAWPKSPMMQDARLSRAYELGWLMPGDPEVSSKGLDQMSLGDFKPSLSKDKKQVARELDRWRAATTPQEIAPPNLAIINPAIHLFLKQQFLKGEGAEKLAAANPPVFQAMVQHVQMLQMALAPPPVADPDAPPSGDAVNAAVESGALVPEGSQGDPLEAALNSGALSPEMPAGAGGPSIDELMSAGILAPAPPEMAQ